MTGSADHVVLDIGIHRVENGLENVPTKKPVRILYQTELPFLNDWSRDEEILEELSKRTESSVDLNSPRANEWQPLEFTRTHIAEAAQLNHFEIFSRRVENLGFDFNIFLLVFYL